MKKCFKCNIEKELSEFYKHSRMADGHLNKCKECTKKDVKIRCYNEPDKIREYEHKRQQNPERRKRKVQYQKNQKLKDPERFLEYKRKSILKNPKNSRERQRKYRQNNPDWQRKIRERNPEQYKARVMVNNAIRDGRLNKEPCKNCGSTKRLQAHHEDYSKPLDVKWLCNKCHIIKHGKKPLLTALENNNE